MQELCKRCNRKIKNTKSVVNGYGPVCWKKIKKESQPNLEKWLD